MVHFGSFARRPVEVMLLEQAPAPLTAILACQRSRYLQYFRQVLKAEDSRQVGRVVQVVMRQVAADQVPSCQVEIGVVDPRLVAAV